MEDLTIVCGNLPVKPNDTLFVKNPFRYADVVKVIDIYFSISTTKNKLLVKSLMVKNIGTEIIDEDDILGKVIMEEGVELYE